MFFKEDLTFNNKQQGNEIHTLKGKEMMGLGTAGMMEKSSHLSCDGAEGRAGLWGRKLVLVCLPSAAAKR